MTKHKQWIIAAVSLALAAAPFAGVIFKDPNLIYAKPYAADRVTAEISEAEVGEEALPAFGTTPLKVGSSGQDVYELQGRLKHLGFFLTGRSTVTSGPKLKMPSPGSSGNSA
ncbi:peptidoglycan-binding domain-containing protein [Paenibacillus rhizoplanae]|uniref:peptidoglycan-binding domain-containing protein n=1 Tax=Paenibacillus rhizoplanae TaxID=1917181 RepID=UPI003610AD99